jgi:chemotaxis protein MotB
MSGTGALPPIIKKIKKGHSGAHGGSWKVAYADFVTAMMAFFLLLWLLSMVSDDQRARVSEYFKSFNLFDKGGQSFMMDGKVVKAKIDIGSSEGDANDSQESKIGGNGTNIFSSGETSVSSADIIKTNLKKEVELKLSNMKDQVLVDIFDGAVRIEVVDKTGGSAMFSSGSKEMTVEGKMALKVIADSIKRVKGKIAIEGHTDATNYAGSQYSNWELSTDRASAARRELENSGMSPDRLIRVAGYAATDPLIKDDPYNPKNRRISIRVFPDEDGSQPASLSEPTGEETAGKAAKENIKDSDPIDNYLMSK